MGLLQKTVETYQNMLEYVGQQREGHAVFAPVSHTVTKADFAVMIDASGKLIDIEAVDKTAPKIIIPVTEASAGRTSSPCAHPLCDQMGYLTADNKIKYDLYVDQLSKWAASEFSHPKLAPILNYVLKDELKKDLQDRGLINLTDEGKLDAKDEKKMICWRVIGIDDGTPTSSWEDRTLFDAYIKYYQASKQTEPNNLCMISGSVEPLASQHPKGIVAAYGNAKLISANDHSGFTYRGRFSEEWQVASISYESSQKAHSALRWLVSEQGVKAVYGGRTFLCWNPQGKKVCSVVGPFQIEGKTFTEPSDYKDELYKTLTGYRNELPADADVIIAVFDAATTGRLSLTYYNELLGSDFLSRLYEWDLSCCWNNGPYGIQSPSLPSIVNYSYGSPRTENGKQTLVADDQLKREQMQRLVACRVDRARIPLDIVKSLVNRASNPVAYDTSLWRRILYTACAVLNKYLSDQKGVMVMSWEMDKRDRSFQFGRLLAAMERVELDYYYKTQEDRQTNAIKSMTEFRQRPWSTYERINRHLNQAYIPRIEGWQKARYSKLKDEIISIISEFPENELNRPLGDTYLMGYDLQHSEFFKSSTTNETKVEE